MCDEFRHTFFDEIRDADFWGDLNSFATHPASSRLQRVEIHIGSWANPPLCWSDRDKAMESVYDWLPLLRDRGILFVI
jgi:hypothetical protein